jgi:hypothetical protein
VINEPPCERSGYVDGVGAVRVNISCSNCGRLVRPSDFQPRADGVLRAVCDGCHYDIAYIDLDLEAGEAA